MKVALMVSILCLLSGCASSEQRYHDYQNQRLSECKHKLDDEYFECIEENTSNYEERFEHSDEQASES